MPQSDVTSITFQQEYFLGDPPPFFTSVEDVQTSTTIISIQGIPSFPGYQYTMDVPSAPPNPDRILTRVTLETQDGVDDDGVIFGGNFRPDTGNIVVVGNLEPVEELAVRNALTVNQGSLSGNIVTDEYAVNTFGLAGIGIANFGYIIPYTERDITVPGDTTEIVFFGINSTGTPRQTQIIIQQQPNAQLVINDGTEQTTDDVLLVENILVPGARVFNSFDIESTASALTIDFSENIFSRTIFKLDMDTSLLPAELSYQSSIPVSSTYNQHQIGMVFDIETNSSNGVTTANFKIRPYAVRNNVVVDSINDSWRVRYAWVTFGKYLSLDLTLADGVNSYNGRYTYEIKSGTFANPIGRREENAITVNNGSSRAITVEVDLDFNWLRVAGEDASGAPAAYLVAFRTGTGIETARTLREAVDDMNANIQLIDGWSDITLTINNTEFYDDVFLEYLEGTAEIPIQPGDNLDLSAVHPIIGENNPDYVFTVDLSNRTLREMTDIKSLYFEAKGRRLGLPVSSTPNFGGMPDSWIDFPGIPRTVLAAGATPAYNATRQIEFTGLERENQGTNPDAYLFYSEGDALGSWSGMGLSDVQSFCDWFNDRVPFIVATPGLFYGGLNALSIQPASGAWRRAGATWFDEFPENSSVVINRIVIKSGQSGIGGNAVFPNNPYIVNQVFNLNTGNPTVSQLASSINIANPGLLEATVLNGNENIPAADITPFSDSLNEPPNDSATFFATFDEQIFEIYDLNNFGTIESLVSTINSDWGSRGLNAFVVTGTADRPDANPGNLSEQNYIADLTASPFVGRGLVSAIDPPDAPQEFIYLDYILNWVGDIGPTIEEQGIQVALGGYVSDGQFFINPAPNSFFEPGYNSLFDATFSVTEAQEIYILVRTRQDVDGTVFTSDPADYQGLTRFSNGFPSQVTNAAQQSGSPFDVWADADWNSGNIPASITIPANANIMTLFADDTNIIDSIQVQINNFPAELDEFAYLALNRTNLNASMTESQQGRVFGLVLDNRGIWDVLIGPEAEIQRVLDGEFDYLNFSFNHDTIDSDESYNFEFFNIDPNIASSVDLIPVPGFPRVAVLRIEGGVKRYLSQLRAEAPPNSLDGCSVDIDILAEGRESGAQGIARVTVFADYRCVYDIGLCDFFWNLTDPPVPEPPDSVENTLVISYTDYIDCDKLDVDGDGDNARISFPLLVTTEGIPVFENANSLLLIKGTYSESVEGFFFPSRSSFGDIQNPACDDLTDNEPLSDRLNQELIFIEDQDDPITDRNEISRIINGVEPYLYIKPQFQFPGIDQQFECGPNEIVVAAIGYQTRDWEAGIRQDDILIGVDTIISNSTFSAPEIEFCYRFYYRRES